MSVEGGDNFPVLQNVEAADSTPFMSAVTPDTLGVLTSAQKGCITSIRILGADENMTGAHLKRTAADMFSPAALFSKDICDLPAAHNELRDFLDKRGANMQTHTTRRIIMTLAHNLYEEPEDTQAAIDIAKSIIAAGRKRTNRSQSTGRSRFTPGSCRKRFHDLAEILSRENRSQCRDSIEGQGQENLRGPWRIVDGIR